MPPCLTHNWETLDSYRDRPLKQHCRGCNTIRTRAWNCDHFTEWDYQAAGPSRADQERARKWFLKGPWMGRRWRRANYQLNLCPPHRREDFVRYHSKAGWYSDDTNRRHRRNYPWMYSTVHLTRLP